METGPLVSVLMTSYNREKYIAEAIESVLASGYRNFELIISDDGSKDKTVEIARAYALKDSRVQVYINEKNIGDYPNRNKAAGYANGKYIKYLDADDIIYSYGLEVMVNYMEQFPEAGFGLASKVSDEKPFPILLSPKEIYIEHFNEYSHFDRAPGSSIIKLDAFKKIGGFSGKRMIGDYEFWLKIACYYSMVKYPFDLYWNRIHEGQESKSEYAKEYPFLRKQVLDEALNHADCPLNSAELIALRKKVKKLDFKESVFGSLSKLKRTIKK
jgi:glycosyltransferase involved in cell wall biosynthesis